MCPATFLPNKTPLVFVPHRSLSVALPSPFPCPVAIIFLLLSLRSCRQSLMLRIIRFTFQVSPKMFILQLKSYTCCYYSWSMHCLSWCMYMHLCVYIVTLALQAMGLWQCKHCSYAVLGFGGQVCIPNITPYYRVLLCSRKGQTVMLASHSMVQIRPAYLA